MEGLLQSDFKKAQELLKEAGYDGTPIVHAHQPGAGCQGAHGEGRLQSRHAVDGLADSGRPPRQEGLARCRWLARVSYVMGSDRHQQFHVRWVLQLGLRESNVWLAVRSVLQAPAPRFLEYGTAINARCLVPAPPTRPSDR
jgi:hypothetical protein